MSMTITWFSNAISAGTGYGTQSKQAVHRLIGDGHNVAVSANYGLQAMATTIDNVPHYPMGYTAYSDDVVAANHRDWCKQHPDGTPLVVALFDAWPLKHPSWDTLPVAIWTMIDHVPVPPAVLEFLAKPNVTPIAVTQFGLEQMQRAGLDEVLYVPMAIDSNVYQFTETWDTGSRVVTGAELMGWGHAKASDHFTVSMVNANKGWPDRKAWGAQLLAMSIFMERHKDVRLYLHTESQGAHGGIQIDRLIDAVGLDRERVRVVNQYAYYRGLPNEAMAALYSATDVLLSATMSEGFGLTPLEAQFCGCPVIVNDFSAQPELAGPDSWLTMGQPFWDAPQQGWWQMPLVPSIVDALEQSYARGRGRSNANREWAMQYDADRVYTEYWRPALARLDEIHAP